VTPSPPPFPLCQEEKRAYLQLDDGVQVEEETVGAPDSHGDPSTARAEGAAQAGHPSSLRVEGAVPGQASAARGDGAEGGEHDSALEYRARIKIGGRPLDPEQSYTVALPRNLVKGAFKIKPLIEFGKAHADELPTEDKCAARLQ
jgi:hypothetical protein